MYNKKEWNYNKQTTDWQPNQQERDDNLEMSIDPAQGNKPSLLCFRSLVCLTQEADIPTVYTECIYIYIYIDKVHLLYVFIVVDSVSFLT